MRISGACLTTLRSLYSCHGTQSCALPSIFYSRFSRQSLPDMARELSLFFLFEYGRSSTTDPFKSVKLLTYVDCFSLHYFGDPTCIISSPNFVSYIHNLIPSTISIPEVKLATVTCFQIITILMQDVIIRMRATKQIVNCRFLTFANFAVNMAYDFEK